MLLALTPHPQAPPATPCAVEIAVRPASDGGLALRFRLRGALERLALPAPQAPGAADGLWRHTCFEAFIAAAGEPAYLEFNFSPSGQWAAYAFDDYRARSPDADPAAAPALTVARHGDHLEVDARIPAAALARIAGAELEVGLTAVVEQRDGTLSYWSLRHPAPHPDFHHRDGFALRLDAGALSPPRQGQP